MVISNQMGMIGAAWFEEEERAEKHRLCKDKIERGIFPGEKYGNSLKWQEIKISKQREGVRLEGKRLYIVP